MTSEHITRAECERIEDARNLQLAEIKDVLKEISGDIKSVTGWMNKSKGALKVILWIVGSVTALISLVKFILNGREP